MSARDAEWGELGEGEEVLFEGGARGRPPLRTALPIYVLVWLFPYLLGGLMLLLAWKHAPVAPTWNVGARFVRMTWQHDGTTATTSAPGPLWGPIDADLPGVGPVELPWTFVVLFAAAVLEVVRLARWRSHRVAVTTRRVLLARGVVRRRVVAHGRTGDEALRRASPSEDALVGLAGGAALLVPGLEPADRQALERALARFEPGPTPAPPDPRARRRALLALALLIALGAALALRLAAAPNSVTLVARRGGAPGAELIHLTVDSPSWGGLRVVPWNDRAPGARLGGGSGGATLEPEAIVGTRWERVPVTFDRVELDAAPWRPRPYSAGVAWRWEGGLLRTELSFALEERGAAIAAERVVLSGTLHTVDGHELPFEVSLPSPGSVTLELEAR